MSGHLHIFLVKSETTLLFSHVLRKIPGGRGGQIMKCYNITKQRTCQIKEGRYVCFVSEVNKSVHQQTEYFGKMYGIIEGIIECSICSIIRHNFSSIKTF